MSVTNWNASACCAPAEIVTPRNVDELVERPLLNQAKEPSRAVVHRSLGADWQAFAANGRA